MTASSCVSRKLNVYISKNGHNITTSCNPKSSQQPGLHTLTAPTVAALEVATRVTSVSCWGTWDGHSLLELMLSLSHCTLTAQSDGWEAPTPSAGYSFWIRHRWWGSVALHHRDEDQHLPFQATVCKAKLNITLALTVVANPDSSELFDKRHSSAREGKDTPHWGFRGDKISLAGKVETEVAGRRWLCVNLYGLTGVVDWRWQLEYSENRKASQLCKNRTTDSSKANVSKKLKM